MTVEEAKKIANDLKGYVENYIPFNANGKATIEKLYRQVLGKTFVPTSCQECYHDALVEITHHLNKYGTMAEEKNFMLKAGAIINCPNFRGGEVFSNDNLTDEVATEYLHAYPEQVDIFERVPDGFDPTSKGGKKK